MIFKHKLNPNTWEVTVTLYKNPKNDNKSKIHLQGNPLIANCFALETMPVLYEEVRKMAQPVLEDNSDQIGYNMRPKTVKERTRDHPKSLWCKFCNYKSKVQSDVQSHTKKKHSRFDKQRNFEDIDELIDGEDEETEEPLTLDEEANMETQSEEIDEVTIEDVEDRDEPGIIHDLNAPEISPAPPTPQPQEHEPSAKIQAGFQQQALRVSENQVLKLKAESEAKDKQVIELQEKVKQIEKDKKALKKIFDDYKKDVVIFRKPMEKTCITNHLQHHDLNNH